MSKIVTEAVAAAKAKAAVVLDLPEWVEKHTAWWMRPVKWNDLGPDRQALWAARRGNPIKWDGVMR